MRLITSDTIYPITGDPIEKGVIVLDQSNSIIQVISQNDAEYTTAYGIAESFNGIICPGFINSHCHLELSYLKGKIEEKIGLPNFILSLQGIRNQFDQDAIQDAIQSAEQHMLERGIVAVADICNGLSTLKQKAKKRLHYHSFIELFAWDESRAEATFLNGLELSKSFIQQNLASSVSAHAPYSCSKSLLQKIAAFANENAKPLTIHNQECAAENELFLSNTGSLKEALKKLGVGYDQWMATGKHSLPSYLSEYTSSWKRLFVHNTFTSPDDAGLLVDDNTYCCLCPNANLFIENRLPAISMLMEKGINITLGTDSLASNHQLCIWSEIQSIQKYFHQIELNDMLKWATLNGAKFMGIEKEFGSIEPGKKPGLVNIFEQNGKQVLNRIC